MTDLAEPTHDLPGIDLAHYAGVARRNAALIAALVGVVTVFATLDALRTPRRYTAATTLQVEPRDPQVVNIQGMHTEAVEDETRYLRTLYQNLKSRELAERVIRDNGLRHERLLGGVPAGPETDWAKLDPGLVDRYLAGLDVEAVPGTRLIKVTYAAADPALAARIANAHVATFVRQGLRQRASINQAGLDFLRDRLGELKARLETSEAALNNYRWQRGILATDEKKENVVVEQLDDLNKELSKAEAERLALEAEVRTIDTQGVEALPEVTRNTTLHELHVQLAVAESDYARIATLFKPNYPGVAELRSKADTLRAHLEAETRRVADAVRNAYRAARDTEDRLRVRLAEQKAQAMAQKDAAVEYTILAREVETNRGLYESVLSRMKEMTVAVEVRATNLSVADKAVPPTASAGPGRLRSIAFAALLAALAGIVLAFVRDALDDSLKTADDVERYGRLPSLGVVPLGASAAAAQPLLPWPFAGRRRAPGGTTIVVSGQPDPISSDAYRQVRTSLLLAQPEGAPRTILVTSARDGEGKTLTAANLAIAFSQIAERVVLIDADLRRPSAHRLFGLAAKPGLTEVLAGRSCLDEVLQAARGDALSIVAAGALAVNPTELLSSPEMRTLIAAVATQFDYVIVDSSAALAAPDAVVLSTLVDGVVLVARGNQTSRRLLQKLRARLAYARASIMGVVLNGVEDETEPYGPHGTMIEVTPPSPPPASRAHQAA
ncbi:MAG TPA: polysaccharide biosynthesis tyrosine autokinase [Candidatus Eisenbacteria bacterium]|nr:polysaccharide biosynthesis tyrosine autokinase [Candidatus Eisenbacteria bacterium]